MAGRDRCGFGCASPLKRSERPRYPDRADQFAERPGHPVGRVPATRPMAGARETATTQVLHSSQQAKPCADRGWMCTG